MSRVKDSRRPKSKQLQDEQQALLAPLLGIVNLPPVKPPRKFHYQCIEQLLVSDPPMPSSSSSPSSSITTVAAAPSLPTMAHPASTPLPQIQQHTRPLRVAQPPPITTFPCFSSSCWSAASSSSSPSAIAQVQLQQKSIGPSSISVPTLRSNPLPQEEIVRHQQAHILRRSMISSSVLPMTNLGGEHHQHRFARLNRNELLDRAKNQQRQIEANEAELDERRRDLALLTNRCNAASENEQHQNRLVENMRDQIEQDERELAQLGQLQREARQLGEHNRQQAEELGRLEADFTCDEALLREAVQKYEVLKAQLELLFQQRANASDAATRRQREINEQRRERAAEPKPSVRVEPFQSETSSNSKKQQQQQKTDFSVSTANSDPAAPRQQQSAVQWRRMEPQLGAIDAGHILPPPVDVLSVRRGSLTTVKRLSWCDRSGGDDQSHFMNALLYQQRLGKSHILIGWNGTPVSVNNNNFFLNGSTEGGFVTNAKARLGLLERGDKSNLGETAASGRNLPRPAAVKNEDQENSIDKQLKEAHKRDKNDRSNHKPLSLSSPLKRQPPTEVNWEEFNKNFGKAEKRELIINEREKICEKNGEDIDVEKEQKPEVKEMEENGKEDIETEEEVRKEKQEDHQREGKILLLEENLEPTESLTLLNEEEEEAGDKIQNGAEPAPRLHEHPQTLHREDDIDNYVLSPDESSTSCGSSLEDDEEEEKIEFDDTWVSKGLVNIKGILSSRSSSNSKELSKRTKNVNFDLIIVFLDVALEGQFDTLVELASKIDISSANSEGVTALHYAICAPNPDIVKFLIDNGANVNALDMDGWSPLHCAASCNNSSIIRLLVENGACPFATTLGKSETAAQLFDLSSDYTDAADYLELVEECMGQINQAKVYAAYDFQAQNDDELSIVEGDELTVLRKGELIEEDLADELSQEEEKSDEKPKETNVLWWFCQHSDTGALGLVPRNYLALFPSWKYRSRYQQISFEVPTFPTLTHFLSTGHQSKEIRQNDELIEDNDMEHILQSNDGKTVEETTGGHQQHLSTYA